MTSLSIEINKQIQIVASKLQLIDKELTQLPEGYMTRTSSHGKTVFYQILKDSEGKRFRRMIKEECSVGSFLRKEHLKAERALLLREKAVLEETLRQLPKEGFEDVTRGLIRKHPWLSADWIKAAERPTAWDDSGWASESYEAFDGWPEEKNHFTSWGLKLRSKSEVLIAEALRKHGIPFRYEQVLQIGYATYAPDFTILRPDGSIVYWEHAGMMRQEKYYRNHLRRMDAYHSVGIDPWNNLIVTYDYADGNIDMREIEMLIQTRILV